VVEVEAEDLFAGLREPARPAISGGGE